VDTWAILAHVGLVGRGMPSNIAWAFCRESYAGEPGLYALGPR
jgi:hypothetical protein